MNHILLLLWNGVYGVTYCNIVTLVDILYVNGALISMEYWFTRNDKILMHFIISGESIFCAYAEYITSIKCIYYIEVEYCTRQSVENTER